MPHHFANHLNMCLREGEGRFEREEKDGEGREREGLKKKKGLSLILQFYCEQTKSSL